MIKQLAQRIKEKLLVWPISPQLVSLVGNSIYESKSRSSGLVEQVELSKVERILVVKLDAIGDIVLSSPFLRELRRNLPNSWITLVVSPRVYNLVELCPYTNEIMTYDCGIQLGGSLARNLRALSLARRNLWDRHFDLAIIPRWDIDYYHGMFLGYYSGAKLRVAYSEEVNSEKKRLNSGFDHLLTHPVYDDITRHEVEYYLNIVRFLGGQVQDEHLELWVSQNDETFVEELLDSFGVSGDLIALGIGAGSPRRMWPIGGYTRLGSWLGECFNTRIVVLGGNSDVQLAREMQMSLGNKIIDLTGKVTLRQAGAVLRRCRMYVGNDSGPMHLAAAVGVPIVEISCHPIDGLISHPNSPKRFGPWGVPHRILQPMALLPCSEACSLPKQHCISQITLKQVKEAVLDLMNSLEITPVVNRDSHLA